MSDIRTIVQQMIDAGKSKEEIEEFVERAKEKMAGKTDDSPKKTETPTVSQPKATGSESVSGGSDLPEINHPTAEQMSEGVSWLQAEGDFVKKMNDHYRGQNTNITFKEAKAGEDAFVMYDADTDETSEAFNIQGFDKRSKTWNTHGSQIESFFNRNKKIDPKFQAQKTKATNVIAEKLEDENFLQNLLGDDYNFSYAEKSERGGKGEDYELVMSALKKQVGNFGGLFGGSFSPGEDFSSMGEQSIEAVIKNAVTKKFEKDKATRSNEAEVKLASTIKEEKTTTTIIDGANKQAKINTLTKEGKALYLGREKIKTLEPGSQDYIKQEEINKELLNQYDGWSRRNSKDLIDPITGISINPEAPEAATAVVITEEDLDKTKDKIKLTYGQNVEQAFNVNGRKKWLSDKQGEETFDVTINDPQARSVFESLGYEIKGSNKNGYEFEIKQKHLAKYYDATVKSDGFTFMSGAKGSTMLGFVDAENPDYDSSKPEGPNNRKTISKKSQSFASKFQGALGISDKSSFTSPQGFFGLTEKNEEQEFTVGEQRFFDQDEYAEDDKSKAFKRMLKDYRDDRFNLIKEGKVLTKMHLLNIDPASTKGNVPIRGSELLVEGFRGIFGGSQADIETMTSPREERDVLEGIAGNSNIKLTTTQKERVKRSGGYRIYEGVAGFVPAIAEFALIDLAIKKGTGIVPGAAKLVSRLGKGRTVTQKGLPGLGGGIKTFKEATTLEKSFYHLGGIIKEEVKMKAAFDEHYHMGGGAGFYAVGNLLPNFKSKYNLLNTFMNANKSGVGGSLSVQAAANLESLIRDVKGKESYQTWVKENYADLELTSQDMLVDYFVFASIGAKGWAFGGGKNWKNNFRTTSRLEKLESELADKITGYKDQLKSGVINPEVKTETEAKLKKAEELFMGVHTKLEGVYDMNDWQDPEKATKMMERQDQNIKAVFGKDVSLKAVNSRKDKDGKELFEFEDSAAEFSKDGKTILVDVNRVEPGKIPHEVFHLTMKKLFDNNPELMNRFKATIESSFQGKMFSDVEIRDKDGKPTGKFKNMSIEELVQNEHGSQVNFDKIKANEFLAYTAEVLANPRYYSKFTANGTWKKLQMDLNKFTNRHVGTSVIESGTKQDLIDFMANFSRSVMAGNLTRKQVNMFQKMKDGKVFAESIEADSRTEQRKNEEASEDYVASNVASKSVELSSKTQKVYDDIVRGKEGRKLDRSIEQITAPSKERGSVAGKEFDGIIYDMIEKMYPDVHRNPDQKYTLALEMVYDLSRGPETKNRGLQGIIKDYTNRKDFGTRTIEKRDGSKEEVKDIYEADGNRRLNDKKIEALESEYNAKFGTPEFIKQAEAEGYKGKQNLTKTVMQTLALRIHDMKRDALDKMDDFAELGYTESTQDMRETGRELVDTSIKDFEFKSQEDISREAKGKKKINPLDYVEPRDLVSIRKNTTDYIKSTKALVDLRPAKLAEAITLETQKLLEKQFGRYKEVENKDGSITLEKVAKKDYYDISKEIFETKERELYEAMLPETRDKYTSETTNAAKSAFRDVYESKGEFTFAELNKGIAKEILTDSQKAEGRDKMTKKPYRKGILNEIIFKGNRKDVHHAKMSYLMPHGAFSVSRKIVDNQLNNPRFAEMLKKMNPGVYEGLKLNQVLTSIKENLRGTTPEALASKKTKLLVDQFAEKIRKGQGARSAMLEVIANNEDLKPYKKEIIDKMKLNIDDLATTGELFVKVGEAGRTLGIIQGKAARPVIFDAKFDGKKGTSVYGELNKLIDVLSEKGIIDKKNINVNKGKSAREKDADFSREYVEEFLPELFNTFDIRLLNMKGADRGGLGTTMGGGEQRFGFRELVPHTSSKKIKGYKFNESTGLYEGKRYKIFDKEMRAGIFEGLKGIKEKLKFDPKFVKVNDNTKVQEIVDKTLEVFENKGVDLFNPKNAKSRKAYVESVKKQLSPDGTLRGYDKMLEANKGMLEYVSEKIFDHVNNAVKSGKKGAIEKAINNVSYLMQIQTNLGGGWFRGLATHNASTLQRSGNLDKALSKRYRSEHELQLANFTGNLLLNTLNYSGNKKGFNENMKPLIREFKQSIINKDLQEKIDSPESGGNTANIYAKKGITTDVMAKANFLLERQIMESIVDLKTGKTYAEIIDGRLQGGAGYKALQVASKKANLPSKNVTTTEMIRNAKIREEAIKSGRIKNKEARGMSTWDFDDTLATTKSGVRARIPNADGLPKPNRKVIFLAGGAGSGKGNVIKKLNLEGQGFKLVNSDISLEWLKKNNGLPENMNDLTKEQRSKLGSLQHQARGIAKRKMMKYKGNADGVVVDGTGGSIKAMEKLVNEFKNKGYDVSMLFVETSLPTALARNKARAERSLLDKIVERNHEAVQGNKSGFKNMFGERFMEVKTDNLKQADAMPKELIDKMNEFVTSYEKVRLDAEQFATEGQKILDRGGEFDFAEFNVVTGGEKGPFFQKALDRAKKFGTSNQFVLTARPPESAGPIYEFLKSQGLEIPLENITGLGNSTGEAKALWMLKKFSEGYNDMYFADDAMQNVKAVRDVLDQLDIKSKVQQALASKNVNLEVNKIMEHSLDVGSEKVFSKAEAKVRGKDIKRRRVFMRDSAADLELLIEPLYGKGKEGIKNKEWFKEELVMPFERGIRDYNTARQSAKNDYMSLRKQNKDVVKEISKPVEGTAFTNDMAMRVYLWNKAGYKIPDLAKTTEAKLVQHITSNPKLQAYAENFARITKQEKGLKEPGENWWGETMAGEVTNINRGVSRKQYLQEWIDVKNEIFTEENLNKMESKLGTEWRENIEDMFDRMETGRTRSLKMDRGSAAMMNYLNGGIGTIMNFNTRSAVLQTISTTNFLNMRENNPIAAARAMGNVKQFAKDFKYIMNSDMLKQRRDGLAMNVTEAEIASAAASSTNPVQSVISKVLKAGYLPTKMADSFAISFGGATFYRNRVKMYEKQGMKTKEAESKAFLDFQVIAERTQQSSRADLLSKQQTSLIGRFILPFANTPMQMNRAGMKDILDISKGRYKNSAEVAEKVGRISYYMGAQVAVFAGLQSALFAMLLNDDDVPEEKIANTKSMMLNTTADSMLRGFGVQGAVMSATKNALQEYFKQSAKPGFTADYSEVAEDLLNISPPIGSKFGMLDRAGDRKKWAKIRKNNEFKFELGNPSLEASLMTIQATTNAPVYSPYQNIFNMQHALSDQYETWQRVLMGAGWTPYSVGVETEDKKKKKKKKKKKSTFKDPYKNAFEL